MRCLRLAEVSLGEPASAHFGSWPYAASNGRLVEVLAVRGEHRDLAVEAAQPPGTIQFWGEVGFSPGVSITVLAGSRFTTTASLHGDRLRLGIDGRVAVEEALAEYANMLAVSTHSGRRVTSPFTCIGLGAESEEEEHVLGQAVHIDQETTVPSAATRPIKSLPGLPPVRLLRATSDRLDGVAMLADSLAQNTLVGRARWLFLLFERAFRQGSDDLIASLVAFLDQHPNAAVLGYSESEVHRWVKRLRPLSMHADDRKTVATESDFLPALARMEQAAYDLLLHKEIWRNASSLRRPAHIDMAAEVGPTGLVTTYRDRAGFAQELVDTDAFATFPRTMTSWDFPEKPDWKWLT